ncbi:hypothetical protein ROLI_031520 [Roseobacter fucihabitans]|uniref:DUF4158 domain-containing protein n=1 Tax=Roseobacter fucihabitans TaxID=1537242 RepID=A0ABZ2BVI4_9RHOB|nr:hypothetical protein [Roseobacter litoralis]
MKGMSEPRRLTLCYYLKYFQLHAQFPRSLDFVSPQVLKFLASQIGSADGDGLPVVPKRTDCFYRRQIIAFVGIRHFDKKARAVFLDWLVEPVLPSAPNEATSDAAITEWFLSMRMIRPKAKALRSWQRQSAGLSAFCLPGSQGGFPMTIGRALMPARDGGWPFSLCRSVAQFRCSQRRKSAQNGFTPGNRLCSRLGSDDPGGCAS